MKNCIILFIFACLAGCTGRQQADTDVIRLTLTKSQDTVSRPRSASGFLSEEKNPFPGIPPEAVTCIPGSKNPQLHYSNIDITTSRSISGIMAYPPPMVNIPILTNVMKSLQYMLFS